MKIKSIIIVIILLSFIAFYFYGNRLSNNKHNPEIETLLNELDYELENSQQYYDAKNNRINTIKETLSLPHDDEQRYWLIRDLYKEYSTLDSDSALCYADIALDIAKKMKRKNLEIEMKLNRVYILSATGLFDEALGCFHSIDVKTLPPYILPQYYECDLFLTNHYKQFVGTVAESSVYNRDINSLLDSLDSVVTSSESNYYWLTGWRYLLTMNTSDSTIIEQLHAGMQDRKFDNLKDAKDAWMLSSLYNKIGDHKNSLKYLIRSALADVRTYNHEIASIEELSELMLEAGDLNRANKYIRYAIVCAEAYKSRVRVGKLAELQFKISQAYQHEVDNRNRGLTRILFIFGIIVVALFVAMIELAKQIKINRIARKELCDANIQLNARVKELNDTQNELQKTNDQLQKLNLSIQKGVVELSLTNEEKEHYIAHIFAICSDFINKFDNYRRNLYQMLVARRFDEVKELTKSPEFANEEVKGLNAIFDRIFIEIFPSFVEEFNSLLKPGEEILVKKGQLNTELRIYALVRLGFSESVKIAQFLHCSVQTVYNTRQRVRLKARFDKTEFLQKVRAISRRGIS